MLDAQVEKETRSSFLSCVDIFFQVPNTRNLPEVAWYRGQLDRQIVHVYV